MQVVYIDVLFILNLIINYFILLAVSKILHRNDKRLRLFAGAFIGAAYACLMFFPQLAFLYTAVLKLVFSATIVAVSFKTAGVKNFLRLFAAFYITNMLFGGIILAVYYLLSPPGLNVRNGVMYVNISPLLLILASAGCYIVIKLIAKYFHRNVHTDDIYLTEIEVDGEKAKFSALLDNGNDLCDAISGYPVIIAEYRKIERIIPQSIRKAFCSGSVNIENFDLMDWNKRVRIVPFGSVGKAGGILPAFRPDSLEISKASLKTSEVLVAVTTNRLSDDGSFYGLLNPHILKNSERAHDTVSNKTEAYF